MSPRIGEIEEKRSPNAIKGKEDDNAKNSKRPLDVQTCFGFHRFFFTFAVSVRQIGRAIARQQRELHQLIHDVHDAFIVR